MKCPAVFCISDIGRANLTGIISRDISTANLAGISHMMASREQIVQSGSIWGLKLQPRWTFQMNPRDQALHLKLHRHGGDKQLTRVFAKL